MPTKPQHQYATLIIGPKKVGVCSRRIGSRERLSIIATCTDDSVAERIVDALNMHQGKLEQLELPVQRMLDEARASLTQERNRASTLSREKNEFESKLRAKQVELDRANIEMGRMRLAMEAAQKTARESA